MIDGASVVRLVSRARLRFDRHARQHVLLGPERGLLLSATASDVVTALAKGQRRVADVVAELAAKYGEASRAAIEADVRELISDLAGRGWLIVEGEGRPSPSAPSATPTVATAPRPYTLVAELTYRCPLMCAYCSNPADLGERRGELDTSAWARVMREAEELGVVQVNLTGGEPLVRADLEAIAGAARAHGHYTNLVTSGVPLTRYRLAALKDAGVDAVQLSLQDVTRAGAMAIAGVDRLDDKIEAARHVGELGLPLTVNVVCHRDNLGRVGDFIRWAEEAGAHRIELANAQYLGWALVNRERLLPPRADLDRARAVALEERERLRGRMEVLFVLPDYHAGYPRACMDGWARRFIVVAPDGLVLPCQAAHTIAGLDFPSVRERSLGSAFYDSEAFRRFRGEGWMPDPCQSCDRRGLDHGGCRCQAFHLTGDAANTDPACRHSPHHGVVLDAVRAAEEPEPPAAGSRPPRAPLRYRALRVVS